MGAGQGYRSVLGVFPGTGIGGGFVYEGRIFRGTRSSCMEVGYLQVASEGPLAGAGPPGTLEGLASRLAISAEAAKAVYRGQAPHLRELAGTDISRIRSSMLAKSIALGDKVIEQIVSRAAEQVGRGIGSLINILAPDVVVLGGGLVEAMPRLYLDAVSQGMKKTVLPSLADCAKLKVSELGDYAGATGAAALVRQEAQEGRRRKSRED
jgi:glucokinase